MEDFVIIGATLCLLVMWVALFFTRESLTFLQNWVLLYCWTFKFNKMTEPKKDRDINYTGWQEEFRNQLSCLWILPHCLPMLWLWANHLTLWVLVSSSEKWDTSIYLVGLLNKLIYVPYFIDSKMYMLPSLKSGGDIQARECSGSPGNIISFCVLHKIRIYRMRTKMAQ